jgi:hypothetical protein
MLGLYSRRLRVYRRNYKLDAITHAVLLICESQGEIYK